MNYKVWLDQEITEAGITYSVQVDAELEFRNEEDPECCGITITQAEVAPLDAKPLKLKYQGGRLEKLIVRDHATLTETIDGLLWAEIQSYTEDNYWELVRDLQDARDDHYL